MSLSSSAYPRWLECHLTSSWSYCMYLSILLLHPTSSNHVAVQYTTVGCRGMPTLSPLSSSSPLSFLLELYLFIFILFLQNRYLEATSRSHSPSLWMVSSKIFPPLPSFVPLPLSPSLPGSFFRSPPYLLHLFWVLIHLQRAQSDSTHNWFEDSEESWNLGWYPIWKREERRGRGWRKGEGGGEVGRDRCEWDVVGRESYINTKRRRKRERIRSDDRKDIPCVDNVGSCQYQNVCSMIRPDSGPCSPPFSTYDIPCHCPFNAGIYTLPLYSMSTQNPGINWLTNVCFLLTSLLSLSIFSSFSFLFFIFFFFVVCLILFSGRLPRDSEGVAKGYYMGGLRGGLCQLEIRLIHILFLPLPLRFFGGEVRESEGEWGRVREALRVAVAQKSWKKIWWK